MKFHIKNLGIVKEAEFELGDMTILCGKNNTGKTYITHAMYGFLRFLSSRSLFQTSFEQSGERLTDSMTLSLSEYRGQLTARADELAERYSLVIHEVLSGNSKRSEIAPTPELSFSADLSDSQLLESIRCLSDALEGSPIQAKISEDKKHISLGQNPDGKDGRSSLDHFRERREFRRMKRRIGTTITESLTPNAFMVDAERTGVMLFHRESDFTRSRLIEALADDSSAKLDSSWLMKRFKANYSHTVRDNIDFVRALPDIAQENSCIFEKHPRVFDVFHDIIGGEYKLTQDGEILYFPFVSGERVALTPMESSRAVRSLFIFSCYLRYVASPGDLLVIDEPELCLHPENQRLIARLFVRLLNAGIKLFITTHSDYIIKELNTLIMLKQKDDGVDRIQEKYGYEEEELLDLGKKKVKIYMTQDAPSLTALPLAEGFDDGRHENHPQKLVEADINQSEGIELPSFDESINKMNAIQGEILFR